ncbi:MAG: leucine-rich repeat protein [Clostridia bacterium]|nr:leucine-rich repeat protein [Clostridia bacterium]
MKTRNKSIVLLLMVFALLTIVSCTKDKVFDLTNEVHGYVDLDFEKYDGIIDRVYNGGIGLSEGELTYIDDNDVVAVFVVLGSGLTERYFSDSRDNISDYLSSDEALNIKASMLATQNNVVKAMSDRGIEFGMVTHYDVLLNGFGVSVKYGRIEEIRQIDGVEKVIISETYDLPTLSSSVLSGTPSQSGSDGIFANDTAYDGAGVLVGILDTGLDLSHPAFANAPRQTALSKNEVMGSIKNTVAFDLMDRGITANDVYISEKIPYAFDYADLDCEVTPSLDSTINYNNNHGTHVAGIIAADCEALQGVAPQAQLAIFKVFSDKTSGANWLNIVNALEDCIVIGVDVVNLSLGSPAGYTYDRSESFDFITGVFDTLDNLGLIVCCATGNNNTSAFDSNTYKSQSLPDNPDNGIISSPASYYASFGVGSINSNTVKYAKVGDYEFSLHDVFDESSVSSNFYSILGDSDEAVFPFVVIGGSGEQSDYDGIDMKGKIAVVKRGTTSFNDKQTLAAENGAIGCIIYNNVEGELNAAVSDLIIPTATISLAAGTYLEELGNGEFYINSALNNYSTSLFSSMGALGDLSIGVDILGIGGYVYSSVCTEYAEHMNTEPYAVYSGTSMACPNIAGVCAAVRGFINDTMPNLTAEQAKETAFRLMMSTSTVLTNEEDVIISPRRQGAGVANIDNIINTQAYLMVEGSDRSKINLGSDYNKEGIYTLYFDLVNITGNEISYQLNESTVTESVVDGYIAEVAYPLTGRTTSFYSDSVLCENGVVTVGAYETVEIKVVIVLSDEDKKYMDDTFENGIYVEGFVFLKNSSDGVDLSIPFIAFYGDWYRLPVFDGTVFEDYQNAPNALYYAKWFTSDSFSFAEMYNLGKYTLPLPEGVEAPETTNDYMAYSDEFGFFMVCASVLRNTTNIQLRLYDEMADTYYINESTGYIKKAYTASNSVVVSYLNFDNDMLSSDFDFSNNQYVYLQLVADYEDVKNVDILSFKLNVDLEAPTLLGAQFDASTSKMQLNVFDNHYLQAIRLYTERDGKTEALSEYALPVYNFERNKDNSLFIDLAPYLSILNDGKIQVELIDYAFNSEVYEISLGVRSTTEAESINHDILNYSGENSTKHDSSQKSNTIYNELGELIYESVSEENSELYSLGNIVSVSATVIENESGYFTINDQGKLLSYSGDGGDIVIPDGVKEIAERVFLNNQTITSVVMPEGLTTIWQSVFFKCRNLTKVVLPSTLTHVYGSAFSECTELVEFNLEDTSLVYGYFFLRNCLKLKELTFPDTDSLYLFNSLYALTSLEKLVFKGNVSYFCGNGQYLPALKEIVFEKNAVLGQATGGSSEFLLCNNLEKIVFKGSVANYSSAFASCLPKLSEVVFEGDVLAMDRYAFNNCPELSRVAFGGDIPARSGSRAFACCPKLAKGYELLPQNTKYVYGEQGIVYDKNVTAIYVPSDWQYDGIYYMPATITTLSPGNFSSVDRVLYNLLYSLKFGDGAYSLSIIFEYDSVNTDRKSMTGIVLNNNISSLPTRCFANNVNLVFDYSRIKEFGDYSLRNTGFEKINMGDNVSYIGRGVWSYCKKLSELNFPTEAVKHTDELYAGLHNITDVTVLTAVDSTYKMFTDCINLRRVVFTQNNGITEIGNYCFMNCGTLKEVIGLENIKYVGASAFKNCSDLTSISLPDVQSIDQYAFANCDSLSIIPYSNRLSYLGVGAFYDCISIESIYIPASLATLENFDSAFAGCTGVEEYIVDNEHNLVVSYHGMLFNKDMTKLLLYPIAARCYSLELPTTCTIITEDAFRGAKHIDFVTGIGVNTIEEGAFKSSSIVRYEMPSLKKIGIEAFAYSQLVTVTINEIEAIGVFAYANCENLTKIEIGQTCDFNIIEVFRNCNLTNIKLLDNCEKFRFIDGFLVNKTNTLVYLYIGTSEDVAIPEGIVKICDEAFINRTNIVNVTLPESLKAVGNKAFFGCSSIKKIVFLSEEAPLLEGKKYDGYSRWYANFVTYIEESDRSIELYVPNGTYLTSLFRSYFDKIYVSTNGVYVPTEGR